MDKGIFQGDTMTLSLRAVSGPGDFSLYRVDGFGTPTVFMNSKDGISGSDQVGVPEPGTFALAAVGGLALWLATRRR